MKLKHVMLGLVLMVLSTTAWAVDCNISAPGLSASQLEQIEKACEATAPLTATQETAVQVEQTAAKVDAVVEKTNEWGPMAKDFAQAIGIAAKELGIAANDFLDSPAGFLTAVLIVWKVAGAEIAGMLICTALIIFVCWLAKKNSASILVKEVSYESVPVLWGLYTYRRPARIQYEENKEWGEGRAFALVANWIIAAFCVTALVAVGF